MILANVEQVINDAMGGSPMLQRMVDIGEIGVVGAYYELVSGRVTSEMGVPGTWPRAERH